jgi:hypothetical protein
VEWIITDFENALFNSVKLLSCSVNVENCVFHLSQCFWRNYKNTPFRICIQKNLEFRITCKKLLAIAFLPKNKILKGFDCVKNMFINSE